MKESLKTLVSQFITFFRWVLFAGFIGIVVGLVGVAFHYGIDLAAALRYDSPWLLLFLPAGGALIVLLYRWCGMERDRGTNFVLVAVRENQPMPLRTTPLIFISTLITHLVGGSSGREGAALQIGGSIASRLGRLLHLDDKDSRVAVMCGMSAAFSALFGTPLTAAIFSMEMVSVGVMYYAALVPCTLSALIGLQVAQLFHVEPVSYSVSGIPVLTLATALQVGGMAILFALLSIAFCKTMHLVTALYGKYLPRPVIRAAVGGALVILLTVLVGTCDYNGAGMEVISRAIGGEAHPAAFLLKILFTAVTLGAGFKGGEIVPVFFTGATFGCVAGPLLGLAPSFSAALGMVAVFCGVTNCPMTSLLLAFELFGGPGLPFFALACAISYMLSGYTGLYSEQKIVYSKVKPELINQKVD